MTAWIWTANILGWPIIHLATAWVVLRRPAEDFSYDGFLFEARSWERGGRFYRDWLRIHHWKSLLPDGAPWVGGMSKKRVAERNRDYLYVFMLETRRAEFAHWCMVACLPIFFIWNPPWARIVMTVYAIGANAPCILAQRYNRVVLTRLLEKLDEKLDHVKIQPTPVIE
jgi:glycosyl-4,4'-diaponeurosporenoate acyltransferase